MLGAGIILLNSNNEVLLLLRDNKFDIPYPNMWDIPGGKVENGEDPESAARREIFEELGIAGLGDLDLFKIITTEKITDFIFWKRIDLNPANINLKEGQTLKYFDLVTINQTQLAFNYNKVLEDFYKEIVNNE